MMPLNQKRNDDEVLKARKKVHHTKVKTGCITCRIRRVKCDETKPKCLRCFNYGAECGGFLPRRPNTPSNTYYASRLTRTILPKTFSAWGNLVLPTTNLFESESEQNYFNLFRNQIASEIFPYFKNGNWTQMISQACTIHPSIRYVAMAIGALGKTFEIARISKTCKFGKYVLLDVERVSGSAKRLEESGIEEIENQAQSHHQQALRLYDKAIRTMQTDVKNSKQDLRTTLIICIVIICFEAIHGNHKSAASQLQIGLSLIQNFQSQAQCKETHPQGYSSPHPDIVEDFLVQIFGRLEIQSMSVFDPRPVEAHILLKHEGKEAIANMPNLFESISQARVYLNLITRRVMHFNGSIHVPRAVPSSSDSSISPNPLLDWSHGNNNCSHNPIPWVELRIPPDQTQNTISSQILNQEKIQLLSELTAWDQASDNLLNSAVNDHSNEIIAALSLRIAALGCRICLLSSFFLNENDYDTLFTEFHQIVKFSSQIITLQNEQSMTVCNINQSSGAVSNLNFSFELALIPALYSVMVKCRHGPTRRKALAILRDNPRREGVWDSMASSGLGAWVINLEEQAARQFHLHNSSYLSSPYPAYSDSILPNMTASPRSLSGFSSSSNHAEVGPGSLALQIPEEIRV